MGKTESYSDPVEEAVRRVVGEEVEQITVRRATVTVEECAEVLGIGRTLAWRGVREGWLPSIRIGDRVLVPTAGLEEMLRRATRRAFGDGPGEGEA